MNAFVSNTMRLDHLSLEPRPEARYREEAASLDKAARPLKSRVNAAALDDHRIAAAASLSSGIPFL